MKVPRENIRWNRGSIGREFIGSLIVSSRDVVELEAMKLVFKAFVMSRLYEVESAYIWQLF
jgi:hypothetical protein